MKTDLMIEAENNAQELAKQFLLGNLIKAASKQFKSLAVPFFELKEHEQKRCLGNLEVDIREAVKSAVDIIASNARLTFRASVDQVVFKDGVKAVLTMGKTDEAHALADVEGSYVTVVIEDRQTLLDIGDALDVQPDQKELL